MARPIVRWTIGNVSEDGFKCLKRSVEAFLKFYHDEFEYYICHNSIDPSRLDWARKMGVKLIDQDSLKDSLKIMPKLDHGCWKLYPPHIGSDSYQIFVDNDLLIHKPIDLERIISEDHAFITEALRKCYGTFDEVIDEGPNVNSGFFGIPKSFDFADSLNKAIATYNVKWDSSYFEEQGLVAFVIKNIPHEVIKLSKISVCLPDACRPSWALPYFFGTHGVHFVGLNKGKSYCWRRYLAKML